jgi:hypothetical protein
VVPHVAAVPRDLASSHRKNKIHNRGIKANTCQLHDCMSIHLIQILTERPEEIFTELIIIIIKVSLVELIY